MANEIVNKYCELTGTPLEEIINKRTDRKTILLRNTLMYLTYMELKPRIGVDLTKKEVYTRIGLDFDMTRHNCYEQVSTYECNMVMYEQDKVFKQVTRILKQEV